jgi:hypothetical protein
MCHGSGWAAAVLVVGAEEGKALEILVQPAGEALEYAARGVLLRQQLDAVVFG